MKGFERLEDCALLWKEVLNSVLTCFVIYIARSP